MKKAYFGVFRDGKCLFRLFNGMPIPIRGKNDVLLMEAMCATIEHHLETVEDALFAGDYVAWDYVEEAGK